MKSPEKVASIISFLNKQKVLILSCIALIAILAFTVSQIDAQNFLSNQSIEVSPPSQDISGNPGQKVNVTAKVRNRSDKTITLAVRVEDFTASGEEGQVALTSESPYAVSNWTRVTPNSFTLAPNEEQEVNGSVSIPEDAAGGRYGSIIFSVVPENENENNAAAVAQELASLFLLKINGPVDEKVSLSSFTAPGLSEYGPVPFELKFANAGNVHARPYGIINVTDMFGQRVADIVVPGNNILPKATRIINAQLDKKFLFGRYTATAIMYYGTEKNQTLTAQTGFIVFPYKISIGVGLVLFLMFKMKKRLKKTMKALFGK